MSDRTFVSRYSQPTFALQVNVDGVAADADVEPEVSLLIEGEETPRWTRTATHESVGAYAVTLSSADTKASLHATLEWAYFTGGTEQAFGQEIEVGPSSPDYDALPASWQVIVERVWLKFSDMFDSPFGGPNLQVYVQTNFGRNRLAQFMVDALQSLNTASSPHASYVLGAQNFPFEQWGGLLTRALYIETIRHLIRSYTEQPEAVLATSVSRLDRRDYANRWQAILTSEEQAMKSELSKYRQANLGLGHVSVLVSGGAYGKLGPTVDSVSHGAAAARGYHWAARWH